MKNSLTALAALALLAGATLAQAQTAPAKMGKMGKMGKMHHDHYLMHDGKMMMNKDGQMSAMTADMTLGNGAKVMADGTVMMKDGKKMMLKEGQEIGMDGKMHAESAHDKMKGGMKGGNAMKGKM